MRCACAGFRESTCTRAMQPKPYCTGVPSNFSWQSRPTPSPRPSRPVPVPAASPSLPRSLRIRESPVQLVQRHAAALLDSPAGVVASYYAAGGLVFGVGLALHGAWHRLATLHAVVAAVQQQPAQALRLLAPDLALSVVSEACLSGHWAAPLQSAARILQGLTLRFAAVWAQEHAPSALPGPLLPLALAACTLVRLAGNFIQYTHTALVLLFGGLARGFARGAYL
ncbi:hypothetical protein ABPG75_005104 [Micractinium tetrahymenae]